MSREAALEAAARRFGEAWASGDVATLESLLSPSYTHVDIYGRRMLRAEWLAYAATRTGSTTRIAFRDITTRHFGDVAIVSLVNDLDRIGEAEAAGHDSCSIHVTQVWRWQDGSWQREAFHATIAADT